MVIPSAHLRCAAAVVAGLALATAHPLGIASAVLMPALALSQPARLTSYGAALSYYGAALWPLVPGAKNFFGADVSVLAAFALWAFTTATLASIWPLVWSADRRQAVWRSPIALLLTVIPPLGIIGFASPLTAAGFLFPRTSWCGLLACAMLSGAFAAWPRGCAAGLAMLTLIANGVHPRDPEPLSGWQGINTRFGAVADSWDSPLAEYETAQWIQQHSLAANAKVVVFPEAVVPTWTAATEAFWQQTLDRLRARGKTILVGARLPIESRQRRPTPYDFSADLVALRGGHPVGSPYLRRAEFSTAEFAYDNAVVIRGAENADFLQRIPVPVAMWNPFRSNTARLNLFGPGVVPIAGERAAVLVCYEQLLTWPILRSVVQNPTVLVGVANDRWVTGTPIPAFQLAAVRAWSRLFGIPVVTATNR